jgi:hypothetical protein
LPAGSRRWPEPNSTSRIPRPPPRSSTPGCSSRPPRFARPHRQDPDAASRSPTPLPGVRRLAAAPGSWVCSSSPGGGGPWSCSRRRRRPGGGGGSDALGRRGVASSDRGARTQPVRAAAAHVRWGAVGRQAGEALSRRRRRGRGELSGRAARCPDSGFKPRRRRDTWRPRGV